MNNSNYDHKAALRSLRGAQNRAEGNAFEEYIEKSCKHYSDTAVAFIEKTPEPFQITRALPQGKFEGYFSKKAQPDYKGTLRGGKTIVFDAKATSTEKIELSALTTEQQECLSMHMLLGAEAGVLLCYSFRDFAYIPFETFMRAKELNGHKHWTVEESKAFAVRMKNGYLDFLTGRRVR